MTFKKETDFFKKYYGVSWEYLKESRNFIYIVISLFFFFTLVGFFIPAPQYISNQILFFIDELLTQTDGLQLGELIQFIFLNNIQSSIASILFGTLLGIFPILAIIINGYLLGFVSEMSVKTDGIFVLWKLLPHGIFELPAVFISMALGLKLGTFIFYKNRFETFKKYLWNSLIVFFFIILPFLILAAIIEGLLIFLA